MKSPLEITNTFFEESNDTRIVWGFEGGNGFENAGTFPTVTEIEGRVSMFFWSSKERAVTFMKKHVDYSNLSLTEYDYKHFCLLLEDNVEFEIMVSLNCEDKENIPLFEPAELLKMCPN